LQIAARELEIAVENEMKNLFKVNSIEIVMIVNLGQLWNFNNANILQFRLN